MLHRLFVTILFLGLAAGVGKLAGFFSSRPVILYLAEDAQGVVQIFTVRPDGSAVSQLTNAAEDVSGFAPAPDGRRIVYTTSARGVGGETVWLMSRNGRTVQTLLSCPNVVCHNLVWAPDSRRLVYERREIDEMGVPAWPHLWWLDTSTRISEPVLAGDRPGAAARFSPDGQWLAYFSPPDSGVWLYNFSDGRSFLLTSELGTAVAWHPQGSSVVFAAFNPVDWAASDDEHGEEEHRHFNMATHLFLFDLASGQSRQLSGDVVMEDSVPAWSPDGNWIAFGRRQVRTNAGRQLWLIDVASGDARSLTGDASITTGPPNWSPDGRFLLFQRFNQADPAGKPGIWLLELASEGKMDMIAPGFMPAWLP